MKDAKKTRLASCFILHPSSFILFCPTSHHQPRLCRAGQHRHRSDHPRAISHARADDRRGIREARQLRADRPARRSVSDALRAGRADSRRPYQIVIAGRNFGCGSSREHAPIAMGAAGVRGGRRGIVSRASSSATASPPANSIPTTQESASATRSRPATSPRSISTPTR